MMDLTALTLSLALGYNTYTGEEILGDFSKRRTQIVYGRGEKRDVRITGCK